MAKLYFAYGSNLNKDQMQRRCPAAKPYSLFHLPDWKLIFRGVADVIPSPGDFVAGGLWIISDDCERALDIYEGYRSDGSGMYRKIEIAIKPYKVRGETFTRIMFYVMNSEGVMPPSHYYLDCIKQGFKDFGLKLKPLMDAVEASYDDKNPSHIERRRHQRDGRPALAPRPSDKKKKKNGNIQVVSTKPKQQQLSLWQKAMTVYGD